MKTLEDLGYEKYDECLGAIRYKDKEGYCITIDINHDYIFKFTEGDAEFFSPDEILAIADMIKEVRNHE